jgi:tetratricopeptide (TPR) repeat protein
MTALLFLALAAPPKAAWTGDEILLRHDVDDMVVRPAAGTTDTAFRPKYINYTVRQDAGDQVLVNDRGQNWWVRKADVYKTADALGPLGRRIALVPTDARAYYRRAHAHQFAGDLAAALKDFDYTIRLFPDVPEYRVARGGLHHQANDPDAALADYDRAISFAPTNDVAHFQRGLLYAGKNDFARAVRDFSEAARLDPRETAPLVARGQVKRRQGRYLAAMTDYDAALRIDADNPEALAAKAWVAATCPDRAERDAAKAVKWGERACQLTGWKSGEELQSLAVAYAEAGQFGKAQSALESAAADARWERSNARWAVWAQIQFAANKPIRDEAERE